MSAVNQHKGIAFRRKMVPRAASEGDQLILSDSSDDKEFSNLTEFDKPDVINALVPNAFSKDSKPVSWTFDSDQPGTDSESHRSLLEEQVLIPDTKETMLSIAFQVFVPFLIAGFGTVGAGLVLDIVQVNVFLMPFKKN